MSLIGRRWLLPGLSAIGIVIADGLALILVTRVFLPQKPPLWATAVFYWALAWPVPLFSHFFHQAPGATVHRPTLVAVGLAGLLDLVILTVLIDQLRRRRGRAA